MKVFISVLSVLVIGVSAFAKAESKANNLNGVWVITERICTDGQPARDRFQIGRDRLEISFSGNYMHADMVIGGEVYRVSEAFFATKNLIYARDTMGYTFSSADELVLVSSGFGQGGTCSQGQALMTILKRK